MCAKWKLVRMCEPGNCFSALKSVSCLVTVYECRLYLLKAHTLIMHKTSVSVKSHLTNREEAETHFSWFKLKAKTLQ